MKITAKSSTVDVGVQLSGNMMHIDSSRVMCNPAASVQ